ncbi:MAG: NfeD family protein [Proteobacteria bacterium]|nr:NfeD family protein [Pseudomonadota bacterium]
MIELMQNMNQYHWLTFSFLLVILEIFGLAGFMMGFSIAGIIVSIMLTFIDLSWEVQWITFALLSLCASIIWYVIQFKKDKADDTTTKLNVKENQLIGQRITLDKDLQTGKGRLKITDSTWSVYTETDLKKGDVVEIAKVDGIILHIKKVS